MEICGEHGSQIVYDSYYCPACEQIEEIRKEHSDEINDMQEHINDLDDRNAELQDKIEELQNVESN